MGIDNFYLREMKSVMDRNLPQGGQVVCLGYPDLLVTDQCLEQLYDADVIDDLPRDRCESQIQAWHKFSQPVYDSIELFRRLDCEVMVLDKIQHRGMEQLVDLNEPLPLDLVGSADLVIDTGTLEHCFNVGTAFRNMCDLVRVSGTVITAAPANKLGHGYYNFCNNLYHDGFRVNGFEIQSLCLLDGRLNQIEIPTKKIGPPPKSIWMCVAQRRSTPAWRWPVQGAYV